MMVKTYLLCEDGQEGYPCERTDCQVCCAHDEREHGMCLDCAHEQDPGHEIDRAMDYFEGYED